MTLTLDAARAVQRPTIRVGRRYEFFSTMQQEYEPPEKRMRKYTGQKLRVIAQTFKPGDEDWEVGVSERMYRVRADDGYEFDAYQGELNGWFKDTGQYFWPDATYGPDHDHTFLVNEKQESQ